MNNDANGYYQGIFNLSNPIYYAIIFIVIIVILVYIFYSYIFFPSKKKYEIDKKELELKNTRLMALFAELDPDPVIRINILGEIIQYNKSAGAIFASPLSEIKSIYKIIPGFNLNVENEIKSNSTHLFYAYINERYYSIIFKGIQYLGIAQLYFNDLTERKNYENQLIESENKFKELTFYLQEQLEKEKQRIGRELHDSIGQNILLIKLKLNEAAANQNLSNGIDDINEALNLTLNDLREIMFNLIPRNLEDFGLHPAVQKLVEYISKSSGVAGSVNVLGKPERMDYQSELYLFRIIQESINNILKHSGADEFHIQMVYTANTVRVLISDNGKGFNKTAAFNNNSKSYGLFNITERIKNLNGVMEIESSEGEGTVIMMEIPLT